MGDWFSRLRDKPPSVKNRYAFLGSLIMTTLVAMAWLAASPFQFVSKTEDPTFSKEGSGAFSQFFGQLKSQTANIFSGTDSEKEMSNDVPEEVPVKSLEEAQNPEFGLEIPQLATSTIERLKKSSRPVLIGTSSSNTRD